MGFLFRLGFLWLMLALCAPIAIAAPPPQPGGPDLLARRAPGLRQLRGPIVAAFAGDSLTIGNSDNNAGSTGGLSYATQVQGRSGGRILIRRQCGIPGNSSAAVALRLWDECLVPGLQLFVLLQGTNDLIQGVAAAATIRNDKLAVRAVHARGLRAVIVAIPPNDANPAGANALNAAKRNAALVEGALFVDPWADARAANGSFVAGASGDGVHPGQIKTAAAADRFLADPAIRPLLPSFGLSALIGSGDLLNTIPNADFSGAYSSGGNLIPNGWSAYGASQTGTWTVSVGADAGGGVNLATIAAAAGATGGYTLQSGNFDITPLATRRVAFSGRVKASGLAASGGTLRIFVQGNADPLEGTGFRIEPLFGFAADGDESFYMEGQVPAAASSVAIFASVQNVANAPVSVAIGEFAIRPVADFQGLDTRTNRQPGRVRRLTASGAISVDDSYILCDATAGAVTITLPAAGVNLYGFGSYGSGYQRRIPGSGLTYTIVKTDVSANACSVAPPASNTLNGSTAAQSIGSQYGRLTVLAAANNLFVVTGQ